MILEFQRWIVHSKAHDGVHIFSNRTLKITWEAPITLRAASSIVFLADSVLRYSMSDGAAFNRTLWEVGLGLGWFQCCK